MPRGSTTQTRTFTYNNRGKLTGTTLPENGTTTFAYNADFTLASKIDAKNQKITYTYDSYKRLTEVKRFTVASDSGSEDTTQRVTHYYDSNPFDGSFTQNGAGRRTATVYYMRRSASGAGALNGQIIEMYSYSTGGLLTKKRITAILQNPVDTYNDVSNYTDVEYTYDSEGRRTQMVYPKGRYRDTGSQGAPWMQDASRTLNYTYDSMGRAHTMAEPSPGPSWVSGVTYNAASQPTNFSGLGETRTYNILGQLTQITAGSSFSERYDYSATENNGRITAKKNLLSGEEVRYVYDSLQRLQSAITETDPLVTQWGQNFTYDGWGNLLGASVAKGSAPTFSVTVNGLTNRITGQSYDANGNQAVTGSSYDVENRLKGAGTYPNYYQYTYDGSNKRVAKSVPLTWDDENGTVFGEELLMFYGAGGERLAEFTMSIVKFGTPSQWYLRFTEKKTLVWFGSKLLRDGKYSVIQDRLGSVRWRRDTTNNQTETADYYPYGQEKPSATTNDREKFATYLRDPESGLDYADQRYHNPGWGRFLTADPYMASAGAGNPGSWNRYAYVEGDPVNHHDPSGLFIVVPGDPPQQPDITPISPGWCVIDGQIVHNPVLCENYPQSPFPHNMAGGTAQIGGTLYTELGADGAKTAEARTAAAKIGSAIQDDDDCFNFLANSTAFLGDKNKLKRWLDEAGTHVTVGSAAYGHAAANYIDSGVTLNGSSVNIAINTSGAFFATGGSAGFLTNIAQVGSIQSGTAQARAMILLHEFTHVFRIQGLPILDDNNENQARINDAVYDNCSKTINSFR